MKTNIKKKPVTVLNYEGEKSYLRKPEQELYSLVCNCMVENQFYRNLEDALKRLEELILECDSTFVMQLGIYAREEMYLRTVPLYIAVILAKHKKLKKNYVARVIQRADELSEILAIYEKYNNGLTPIASSLKNGVRKAFEKFDAYQLTKYKGSRNAIKLKDVVKLVRPNPKFNKNIDDASLFYHNIIGKLPKIMRWETELSVGIQNGKTKKEIWEYLIESKKLGYMAVLRNLRNILKAGVSEKHIKIIEEYLINENAVKNSKQFPFRFLAAYRELSNDWELTSNIYTPYLLNSLEKAIDHTAETIKMDGTLLIASDVSDSMDNPISKKSKISRKDVGLVLSQLLQTQTRCVTSVFGELFKVVMFPKNSIIRNSMDVSKYNVGYSTNGYLVLKYAVEIAKTGELLFDKIAIFTDCELYNSDKNSHTFKKLWLEYKKLNPMCKLYLFNLAGYETLPVNLGNDVIEIAGWSDRIFDLIDAQEKSESIVDKIKSIVF